MNKEELDVLEKLLLRTRVSGRGDVEKSLMQETTVYKRDRASLVFFKVPKQEVLIETKSTFVEFYSFFQENLRQQQTRTK